MWPQYLMAFAGLLFIVGLFAFLQLNVKPTETATTEDVKQPPKGPSTNVATSPSSSAPEAGIMVDISFDTLPTVAPDGIVQIFEIRQAGNGGVTPYSDPDGINPIPMRYQVKPGEIINWHDAFPEWPIWGVAKCEVTSTTAESVFDAIVSLKLVFRGMVLDDPNKPHKVGDVIESRTGGPQMRASDVAFTRESGFKIGRIYPHTPYIIYFVNRTRFEVKVELPEFGVVQDFSRSGPDFERKIRMKPGRMTGSHLAASLNASFLPTPPSPTPSQPNTPEKK